MIKTRRTKRTFSPEFKLEAFEQVVVKYQRDVREVALALELNPDHLRKWIRLYKQELQGIEPAGNAITPEQREIQQIKAQGNDSNLLIVFYVQIMPDDFVMQLHRF